MYLRNPKIGYKTLRIRDQKHKSIKNKHKNTKKFPSTKMKFSDFNI